jgi:hypothetical protein
MATLAALILGVYVMRPVLVASYAEPPSNSPFYYIEVLVTNTGHVSINNVTVTCAGNKAVFSGKHTMVINGMITITVYKTPDLKPGESFIASCTLPWFFYMNEEMGLISFGDMALQKQKIPALSFAVRYGNPIPASVNFRPELIDTTAFVSYPVTAMDAKFVVDYDVFGFKRSKSIHMTGGKLGKFIWHIQPSDLATIQDGVGGIKITVGGPMLTLGLPTEGFPYSGTN